MWARRIGVPDKWPSRIKIVIVSLMTASMGLALWNYMSHAHIGYLDLSRPAADAVVCLTDGHWPDTEFHMASHFFRQWLDFQFSQANNDAWLMKFQCHATETTFHKCGDVQVRLSDVQRPLHFPATGIIGTTTPLQVLSTGFFLLTFAFWLSVTFHDLALVESRHSSFILDLHGVQQEFPRLTRLFTISLAPLRRLGLLTKQDKACHRLAAWIIFGLLLLPALIWSLIFQFSVAWPALWVAFVRYPVRLSRVAVFTASFFMGIYMATLCVLMGRALLGVNWFSVPSYGVTWETNGTSATDGTATQGKCICGCTYRLSREVMQNLCLIGLGGAIRAVAVGMRCLKGLRRSNWANLISVQFPVPAIAYPVLWYQPDGSPIANRDEDMEVQSEIAFDPFALMDEQPNSGMTLVHLEPQYARRRVPGLRAVGAARGTFQAQLRTTEHHNARSTTLLYDADVEQDIGCCGFPLFGSLFDNMSSENSIDATRSSRSASSRASKFSGQLSSFDRFSSLFERGSCARRRTEHLPRIESECELTPNDLPVESECQPPER
eukprot:TRINITY_DN30970_c0_g1_i1.p1 TRINITY_DN30970_c0_g1~~TRINITY_DN30970_c0_g1_i1.p1  ORF type:complete len:550 (+),score=24.46 TRINITY_DN30970_c0_g1_i1:73-1722(+)